MQLVSEVVHFHLGSKVVEQSLGLLRGVHRSVSEIDAVAIEQLGHKTAGAEAPSS